MNISKNYTALAFFFLEMDGGNGYQKGYSIKKE